MLPWFENIPVISWVALRGRCRGCGTTIPWRYPFVEASLAALWVACFLRWGTTPAGAHAAILCFLLLGLAFTDLETLLLPDKMTLYGAAFALVLSFLPAGAPIDWLRSVEGFALGGGILLLISGAYYVLRRQQGMGMGDVKLLAMIGAFLGPAPVLLVLFLGTIATAIAAIVWLVLRILRKGDMGRWSQHPMPYGTFLALAGIFVQFYGLPILKWYMGTSG
jgi:leader peptidase (prepilin peptidase)/N-methyltransferase